MTDIKPPYIPTGWMDSFLELIKRIRIEKVDRHLIAQYNITTLGNASKVVSALKFLRIIDEKGKVNEENLHSLKLEGNAGKQNLKKLVEEAYSDLTSKIDITKAKEEDLLNYFLGNYKYSSVQATRALKLFRYLITKSGIAVSDELSTSEISKKGRPKGSINKQKKNIDKNLEKREKQKIQNKIEEENEEIDEGSIGIQIRGKSLIMDLWLTDKEDIKPNLDIISQILNLNLKKKKEKEE